MADVLLEARDLHVSYGAIRALQGFSLTLREREIVAIISANGVIEIGRASCRERV